MITFGLTALGSFIAGDVVTLLLARIIPAASAKVAAPAVMKGLRLAARQYGKTPQRTRQEWDNYALQHCSPDVWERLKNDQ